MDAQKAIEEIVKLDEQIVELQKKFESNAESEKERALIAMAKELLADVGQDDMIPLKLIRVVEMSANLENAISILVTGLSHANDDVRHLYGEALISVAAEDGVDVLAPAVEYALEKADLSARELPYILASLEEPGVGKFLVRFLTAEDADIVAGAIEACAQIDAPESLDALNALVDDEREITDMDETEDDVITVGMLAKEAVELIESEME